MILILHLIGCGGTGAWVVETWGEEYIEQEIPASVFADGCAVTYDNFEVALAGASLLDGDGTAVGELPGATFDMVTPGPQAVGSVDVPATYYATARFQIAASTGPSVRSAGTLTCGGGSKTFDWSFTTATTYDCEPADLTIPAGGEATTQLTIHGDHLFYDGLENADAAVRGQAVFDADADGDGAVTQDELAAVSVATLGYSVGQYSEVTTLADFVTFLTQTLGHVDGEGHCQVDL
jgi:hypothetical protein